MPLAPVLQNDFTAGFKTEFTGLNFPENAVTQTSNCVYPLIGDVTRRKGFNKETNGVSVLTGTSGDGVSFNTHKWKNVGGDGLTEILAIQSGGTLYFCLSSNASVANPLSAQILASTVSISTFQATGNVNNVAITECQFTDGNGFLIVFHKDCDPFFCTYNSANQTVTATLINIKIRDFAGIPESIPDNLRPTVLTPEHQYNLQNQGWTAGTPWTATIYDSNVNPFAFPTGTFHIGDTITIPVASQTNTTSLTNGSQIELRFASFFDLTNYFSLNITVNSYVTPFTSITGTVTGASVSAPYIFSYEFGNAVKFDNGTTHTDSYVISASMVNVGFLQTWQTQIGNSPSNSDVWWLYKNTNNVFSPSTTISNVQQAFGPAPKGYYVTGAFSQQRSSISGIGGLTSIITASRPSTGCWFQGRVFFTGVNASQQPTGDAPYYTWTENIYFSQVITTAAQFGNCYQINDPTSQTFFDILPTDGGVITIQGSGTIYKLFPLENGLIVFAANGIWFITGSQGIGFSASDYTIRNISRVQNIGYSSYINVNGFPMFWNEEGIYYVTPNQMGTGMGGNAMSLSVQNLALETILTYFQGIPKLSKQFARGDYDNIHYTIQWAFRSTQETGINDRYHLDTILCFNVLKKSFYIYNMPVTPVGTSGQTPYVRGLKFITYPGGTASPAPSFKYIVFDGASSTIFAEENDTTFVDWKFVDSVGTNFVSSFTTGYHLAGKALMKFEDTYIYLFLRNTSNNSYKIQSIWNFGINRSSGKWSSIQLIQDNTNTSNFGMIFRRHKLRGRGMALQIKIQSFDGKPFDIMGWSLLDNVMQGV